MGEFTLTYADEPAGAREGTTPSITDLQPFCVASDILKKNNVAPQHATFEDGYWILGADFRLFPDQPASLSWGVMSRQQSGADGAFAAPITLSLLLDDLYSGIGITLTFDPYGPTWCSALHIDWYRDSTIISSKDFAPDAWTYTCYNEVRSFNAVRITFSAMSQAYRYLKLAAITYGITRVFGSDEIFSLDLFQDCNLISDELSVNTLSFELRNKSDIAFLFQRRQTLQAKEGGELVGMYYIDTHDNPKPNRYNIKTVDIVGLAAMAGDHRGGIYDGVPAADIVADILETIPWEMDADLQDVLLFGWLPIASRRDNLRQVAFALGALVRTARRENIQITRPSTAEIKGTFDDLSSYDSGTLSTGAIVTAVRVTAYRYTLGNDAQTLFDEALDGEAELTFSGPTGGLTISGGTIMESCANMVRFSGTGGTVRITGKSYQRAERVYTKNNPLAGANDASNVISYSGMTLVSTENAARVLADCYAYCLRAETVSGKVLTGGQAPGDYVAILTDTDGIRTGHLLSLDYSISAKTAADVVVLADYEGGDSA